MKLPAHHPLRLQLSDEVHSRPPEPLVSPVRLSYIALMSPSAQRDAEWERVRELGRRFGVTVPAGPVSHFSETFGRFRLKWERHTEFSRYTFIVQGSGEDESFSRSALADVPQDWLEALPGEMICATHVAVLKWDAEPDLERISAQSFRGNVIVGASIGDGAGRAFTDFRIADDGFSRLLVHDRNLTPRQCGRMVQRLLEIETYRIMALLALPVAQKAWPFQTRCERELVEITQTLAGSAGKDESDLLSRLTQLEAAIESQGSENDYRFGASAAYYDLVKSRIAELRESRIDGLQTFQQFIERRLAPAMSTCRTVAARQESLSQRVARATQLLSTRVDLTRERQNQAVLESMNRRAELQLRLQSTVEGLSVAAITYYLVGLVGYAAKAMQAAGLRVHPELMMGASIPLIAILAALGIRRIRRAVTRSPKAGT